MERCCELPRGRIRHVERLIGSVDDALEVGIGRNAASLPQHAVQRKPDRHLDEQGKTTCGRIDAPVLVQGHELLVQLLTVILVLLLQALDLRLDVLHRLHRLGLLVRQGKEHQTNEQGEQDDGNSIFWNDAVEEGKNPAEEVEKQLPRIHSSPPGVVSARASGEPGTGSMPPSCQG